MIKRILITSLCICFFLTGCASMEAEKLKKRGYNQIDDWTNWNENTDSGLEYLLKSSELDPDNEEILKNIGRLYWIKGNYDKAEFYLQKAIHQNEKYGAAWNNLGWVYEDKALYSKMRDAFEKAIKYSSSVEAWDQIGLGLAYYNMQEYDLAEEHFQKALAMENKENSKPSAKMYIGYTLFKTGKQKEAELMFEDYVSLYPKKHWANKHIGRFYYTKEKLDLAKKYLKEAIRIDNEYTWAWNNLGWLYWKMGQYSKMREMFEKALTFLKQKEDAFNYIGLGAAYYYLGDYSKAEELFKQSSKLVKNDSEKKSLSGSWLLLAAKQGDFGLVKKLWSDRPSLHIHIDIINNEGVIHFIEKGHLGDLAGLKIGDKIVNIDGEPLVDNGSLKLIEKQFKYGQHIDIVIRRGEEKLTKRIVLDYLHYLPQYTSISFPEEEPDTEPPSIKILEPRIKERGIKRVSSNNNQLMIRGEAIDKSGIYQIKINGIEAKFSSNGEFWQKAKLAYGSNMIRVVAIDLKQNIAEKSFMIERKTNIIPAGIDDLDTDIQPIATGKYHALIIAIQDYAYESVNDLDYPIADAMKLKELLQQDYTFNENNIMFLKNPDRKSIIRSFDILAKKLDRDSNLLIFFSGHGYWDKKLQQGFWIPSDARWEERSEWLANNTVSDYLRGINTQHSLVITDACFSGSIFKSKTAFSKTDNSIYEIYKLPSRKAITSGAMETVPDRSIFLEYLLKRLRENGKRYLDAMSLYTSMRQAVINNSPTAQKPLYGVIHQSGDEGGDFIFIHR